MKDTGYKLSLAAAIILLLPLTSTAQLRGEFGFDFGMAIPQGAFSQNTDRSGFGINGHGGVHLGRSPIFLGLDAGIHVYGNESRRVPLSTTIPDIEARVRTTNNIAQLHGMIRLQPVDGNVRPYLDGLYGFKYLYTHTSLESLHNEYEAVIGSTNQDDYTLSYGFGAGLDVQLWRGPMGEDQRVGRVYLTMGARYLRSGEAEYLREGDIRRENGKVYFETTRSRVDTIQPRLGVTIAF